MVDVAISASSFAFNHVERREKQRLVFAKSLSACDCVPRTENREQEHEHEQEQDKSTTSSREGLLSAGLLIINH